MTNRKEQKSWVAVIKEGSDNFVTADQSLFESQWEKSAPREFFWDTATKYIVGVIIALSILDAVAENVLGSSIVCNASKGRDRDFFNTFCASYVPAVGWYPLFVVFHAIAIIVPHYLWAYKYSGYFNSFFRVSKMLGYCSYSERNFQIVDYLDTTFTTCIKTWMYTCYVMKLIMQLLVACSGFFWAILFFADINETFICQAGGSDDSRWFSLLPNKPEECTLWSIQFFTMVHYTWLFLLVVLILLHFRSIVWCLSPHPEILGSEMVAKFSFQSGISPHYHLFDIKSLHKCKDFVRKILLSIFLQLPLCGSGPRIRNNLDFLTLKLFCSDAGLGHILRNTQILLKIKELNNNDMRITKLHQFQQREGIESGGIITSEAIKGTDADIIWNFDKKAEDPGFFHSSSFSRRPLAIQDTLILPKSVRSIVLGFASLCRSRRAAIYIKFGSPSMGIPSALARVFNNVYVLNFDCHFQTENDIFYLKKDYTFGIQTIDYPEDIFSSEVHRSNDFGESLDDVVDADFIVVGPVEKKRYLSTIRLCLAKLEGVYFGVNTKLLTIYPKKIAATDTDLFCDFVPSKIYFKEREQRVAKTSDKSPAWPPGKSSKKGHNLSSWTAKIPIGETYCQVAFKVYDRTDVKEAQNDN